MRHSGPKMTKSKPRGDSPKFIVHMKEGHIANIKPISRFFAYMMSAVEFTPPNLGSSAFA